MVAEHVNSGGLRVLVTLPWGRRLGGAEAMLQMVLDGAHDTSHTLELVFFEPGPWPVELREAGFRADVLAAGRLREPWRWAAAVLALARIMRTRRPDLIVNWAAKTHLYGAPAAALAGMADRLVWWQQLIPDGHWIDRVATALPARAVLCYSAAAARAQARLSPARRTHVVAAGARLPGIGGEAVPGGWQPGASTPEQPGGATPEQPGGSMPEQPAGSTSDVNFSGSNQSDWLASKINNNHTERASLSPIPFGVPVASLPSIPQGVPVASLPSIPQGVPVVSWPPIPPGLPVVGLVGRLQPWKGQDRLLRAQALLRERGHPFHLLIVGGDAYGLSSDYAAALPMLVEELGLADAVTMTGQVPDAGPYIERMDVLVNASNPEPFGIVLLEAMARGISVMAVDSGGPAEFIQAGVTGLLARSGEPAALADALERLLADPELRRRLGDAGRERFLRDFTDAAMRRRFFGQLQAIAGSAPR